MQQGTHRVKMIKRKKKWVSVGMSSLALLLTTGMFAPTMASATEVTVTATATVKVDFTVQVGAVRVAPGTEVTQEMIFGQITGYPKDAKLTLLDPISGRLNGLPAGESVLVSVSVMATGTNKIVDVPVVITEAKDQVIDQKRQEQDAQRQKAEEVRRQAEEAKRRQVEDAKRKEDEKKHQIAQDEKIQEPTIIQGTSGVTITPAKEASFLELSFVNTDGTPIPIVVSKGDNGIWSSKYLTKGVTVAEKTGVVTISSEVLDSGTTVRAINALPSGKASRVAMLKFEVKETPKVEKKESSKQDLANKETEKRQAEEERKREEEAKKRQAEEERKREEEAKKRQAEEEQKRQEAESNKIIAFMDTDSGVTISGKKKYLAKVESVKVVKTQTPSLAEVVSESYDLTLLDKNGQSVQPDGKVTVTAPISGEVDKVYYVHDNKRESLDFIVNDDATVSFDTSHFSLYTIIYHLSNVPPQTEEEKTPTPPMEQPETAPKEKMKPQNLSKQNSEQSRQKVTPRHQSRKSELSPKSSRSRKQLPRTGVAVTRQDMMTERLMSMLLSVLGFLGVTAVVSYWWTNDFNQKD